MSPHERQRELRAELRRELQQCLEHVDELRARLREWQQARAEAVLTNLRDS